MEIKFETAFLKSVKKYASIKKVVQKKVDIIIENPIAMGEPVEEKLAGILFMSGEA